MQNARDSVASVDDGAIEKRKSTCVQNRRKLSLNETIPTSVTGKVQSQGGLEPQRRNQPPTPSMNRAQPRSHYCVVPNKKPPAPRGNKSSGSWSPQPASSKQWNSPRHTLRNATHQARARFCLAGRRARGRGLGQRTQERSVSEDAEGHRCLHQRRQYAFKNHPGPASRQTTQQPKRPTHAGLHIHDCTHGWKGI